VWDILSKEMKRIIYQALARLWGNGRFSAWDEKTLSYIKSLGTDYLWLTGIPRHAHGKDFVKGDLGSPYSITDWMDVNPYMADDAEKRMQEFDALVGRVHDAGLKLMIDCIPNHVARDYQGGIVHHDYCDGDWTDTYKNDWSSPQTYSTMLEVLRFWASKGVDGFRCDMVELVPMEPQKALISAIKEEFPGTVFVAETYNKGNYRPFIEYVGFDLLYDKSGLYDSLRQIYCSGYTSRAITWNWQWLGEFQSAALNFLENHDEQRLTCSDYLGPYRNGFAALAVSLLFNDSSFMLYFGQEVGENASESDNGRTSIFSRTEPEAIADLYKYVVEDENLDARELKFLNKYKSMLAYAKIPTFSRGKCWDLCYCNETSEGFNPDRHFAFLRYDDDSAYLVVCNFSDCEAQMTVNIPEELRHICRRSAKSLKVGPDDAVVIKL